MKLIFKIFLFFYFLLFATCISFAQNWTQQCDQGKTGPTGSCTANYVAPLRENAVAFTIGTNIYVCTGLAAAGPTDKADVDMWDQTTGTWTHKTDFPGLKRCKAIGFSLSNGKGYIALGVRENPSVINYSDIWEYTPGTDTWAQLTSDDYPGGARRDAGVFVIGAKAYVGCGYKPGGGGSETQDFYEFDPSKAAGSKWTAKANFAGSVREEPVAFSIGAFGYMGTGLNTILAGNPNYKDFYKYDPATDTWTAIADYGSSTVSDAVGFSMNSLGYVALGANPARNDIWEYNPTTNTWTQTADFGGSKRLKSVVAVIGTCAYIGTGYGTVALADSRDWWGSCTVSLPIELLSFDAQSHKNYVTLNWTTATETNNDFFAVEKSADAVNFENIATVDGAGNSIIIRNYQISDEDPSPDISYYRLKQTDYDGKYEYSKIISVDRKGDFTFDVSPNPSNGEKVSINFSNGAKAKRISIMIYDSKGSEMFKKVISLSDFEKQTVAIQPLLTIAPGVYTIISNSEQYIYKQRFIIY